MNVRNNILVAGALLGVCLGSTAGFACDFLPMGGKACEALCKIVYDEGLPREICIIGSHAPAPTPGPEQK